MNSHILSFINFVVTVGGAFAFGYKATEYTFSGSNAFLAVRACINLKSLKIYFSNILLPHNYIIVWSWSFYGHFRRGFLSLQQMMTGLLFASVVFCADLYFLIREASWQMENSIYVTFVSHLIEPNMYCNQCGI